MMKSGVWWPVLVALAAATFIAALIVAPIVAVTDLSIPEVVAPVSACVAVVALVLQVQTAREQRRAVVHAHLEVEYIEDLLGTALNLIAILTNEGPGEARDVEMTFTDDFMKDSPLQPLKVRVLGKTPRRFALGNINIGPLRGRVTWKDATGSHEEEYELENPSDDAVSPDL